MELGIGDRLILLSILPKEGDLATVRIVHELRQGLSFTEEEHKSCEIRLEGDGIVWASGGDVTKEISIGPKAHVLITEALEKLNNEEALTEDHLSVWEKFCDELVAL